MNDTNVKIADATEVLKIYDADSFLQRLIDIDFETMDGLTKEAEGDLEKWVTLFTAYPESYKVLLAGNKVAGYWHFVCLKSKSFELAKKGKLPECEMTLKNTVNIKKPDDYKGYFVAVTIAKEYRSFNNTRLLINSFTEKIQELAERGVFFDEWCTNAWTEEGQAIAKTFNFENHGKIEFGGEAFTSKFRPTEKTPVFGRFSKLIKLYKNHYNY